jgi:putative exosortase-associated protein (TIGR04073 family)
MNHFHRHAIACIAALLAVSTSALAQFVVPRPQPGAPSAPPLTSPSAAPPAATTPAITPAAADPAATRTPRSIDRIIAVVNDEVITVNEVKHRTLVAEAQLKRQKIQPPSREVLERQVLERMIVDRAQLQLAKETGVRVDDATVNAALARIAESNGMNVQTMRQRLEADGVSFTQFREDIRQDIVLNRLREREVDARVQISDSELDNFIAEQSGLAADAEEINLAQILLRLPENTTPQRLDEARKRADEIIAQLKAGAEFARLGELRRSIEQTSLEEGREVGNTTGFIRGFNKSLARTGIGAFEIITSPIPPFDPIATDYMSENPVYPDSYAPGLPSDSIFATDTYVGFGGGDIVPLVPGSRFRIFD